MKTNCLTTSIILLVTLMIAACGGNGSSNGKSVDIPPYAVNKGAYFADQQTKTAQALWGIVEVNHGYKNFGTYKGGSQLNGRAVEADGLYFVMLQLSTAISLNTYLFERQFEYTLHLLLHEKNAENPHNLNMSAMSSYGAGTYIPVESAYSDTYYFYKNDALEEAKTWIETLEKQPNQPSKYNAKEEEGGVKTYKATIGKAVEFFGVKDLKKDRFLALYLDCGAVVEYRAGTFRTPGEVIGKTIDCVTDNSNKVLIYELN